MKQLVNGIAVSDGDARTRRRFTIEDCVDIVSLPLHVSVEIRMHGDIGVAVLLIPVTTGRFQKLSRSTHAETWNRDLLLGKATEKQTLAGTAKDVRALQNSHLVWIFCVFGEHWSDHSQESFMYQVRDEASR